MQPPLLALFAVDAGERNLVPQPDAAGMFCWELPPGRYLLYAPANLHGGSERYSEMPAGVTLRVLAALIVSEAIPVGYVGELVLEVEADWILGDDDAQYAVSGLSVQSANVDARRWLKQHYPGSNLETDTPRLVVDPELSDLLVVYSPDRTRDVLDRLMPKLLQEEPR